MHLIGLVLRCTPNQPQMRALCESYDMKRVSVYSVMVMLLTSCALFTPEISEDQSFGQECKLKTEKLDLSVAVLPWKESEGCDEKCLVLPAIVSGGTLVVSGSIVLTNNTLHWLEYQGKCNLGLGKYLTNPDGKEIEVMTQSCVLECDLETGQCECIGKS